MQLYVGQLDSSDTVEDLEQFFKGFHKKAAFEIVKLKRKSGSLYYGLITIESDRLANKAQKKLNLSKLNGRRVHVREFEYRSGGNERRALNWRELPWKLAERRMCERREQSRREKIDVTEDEPEYSGYDNFSVKHSLR